MAWKAMTPAEVCDFMDFWAAQSWPMRREEVHRLAVERFGWSTEVEKGREYLMNSASGLTIPDVATIHSKGDLLYLSLSVTDVVRDGSDEGAAFIGDAFAHLVREGESRWGAPRQKTAHGNRYVRWDVAGGSRIEFSMSDESVSAEFDTPQRVERDRALGAR